MNNQKRLLSTVTGWLKCLCLLTVILMLAGCTTSKVPYTPPMLPANLAAPCADVPTPDTDSWDDLAQDYINLAWQYTRCAARHDAVVKAWPK